jgi:hypothetical protein
MSHRRLRGDVLKIIAQGNALPDSRNKDSKRAVSPMWPRTKRDIRCVRPLVEDLQRKRFVQRRYGEVLSWRLQIRGSAGDAGELMRLHAKSIRCAMAAATFALLLAGMAVGVVGQVRTESGNVEGFTSTDGKVQIFKGSRNQYRPGRVQGRLPNLARAACKAMCLATWCFATPAPAKIACT